ncbi:MAG: hypothetical protein HYV97_03510 [Bdellovibrio sp.]|nr:hypothetical protein [Bdellovibrio sp.]
MYNLNFMRISIFLGLLAFMWGHAAFSSSDLSLQDQNALKEMFNRPFPMIQSGEEINNYQLHLIGHKFAAVSTQEGFPLAVFDLTLSHLSYAKIILGGFLIKDFSLKGIFRQKNCAEHALKLAQKEFKDKEPKESDLSECDSDADSLVLDAWKDLRMNDRWAERQGILQKSADGHAFQESSFSLAEFHYPSPDIEVNSKAPFIDLANVLYPEETWNVDSISAFMDEFEMIHHPETKSYEMVWNRDKRVNKKKLKLPGFVLNFANPAANIIYKNKIRRIEQYADITKNRWWPYGAIITMFVYRVTDKLIDRLNYHESQMIALLESGLRFEYNLPMAAPLIDLAADLVYLSKTPAPQHFRSGAEYRKSLMAYQEKARAKVVQKIDKRARKNNWSYELVGNDKFVVVRDKDQKFKGIYSAAIKPHILARYVSQHVSGKTAAFKVAERLGLDVAGLLAKTFLKTYFKLPIPYVNVVVQLPRDFWDNLVRTRMKKEINLEGELVSLVDEARSCRLDLGLSKAELATVRKRLDAAYLNPYEIPLKTEAEVIEKNLELLKKALNGETQIQDLRQELGQNSLPMAL